MRDINMRGLATAGALAAILAGIGGTVPPTAFAAPTQAGTLTVTKAGKGRYKVFQVLSADSVTPDGKMTNVGVGPNEDAVVQALKAAGVTGLESYDKGLDARVRANIIADALAGVPEDKRTSVANAMAKALSATGTPVDTYTPVDGKLDVTGLDTGYYLVASDTTDATGWSDSAMTDAMLVPLGTDGATKDSKISVPTVDKKVDQAKVSDNGLVEGKVTKSTYTITGTMPANIDQFDTYKYTFKDTLPAGVNVTQDELATWGVTIKTSDGVDLSGKFTATVTAGSDDNSVITWTCDDIKSATAVTKDTKVTIEYTPVLDEHDVKALFDKASELSKPQMNKVEVSYPNSPYASGEGHTPESTTKVYSYNLVIKKVKEDAQALAGAKFSLTEEGTGKAVGKDITANDDGTFTFTGLKPNTKYVITETTVPAGYKAIAPIGFTITETKDAEQTAVVAINGQKDSDPSNAAVFAVTDATVNATITNVSGQSMFQTGQQGIITGVVVGALALTLSVATLVKRHGERSEEA